ncbi:hypothetical protein SAMN06272735_9186 [Streptomyces sp. TLI_55]|nr:hypothetical protein SAMN06272735_9186 [Streptomyces sp. TLI_55]
MPVDKGTVNEAPPKAPPRRRTIDTAITMALVALAVGALGFALLQGL